jgi:hypothetical protein
MITAVENTNHCLINNTILIDINSALILSRLKNPQSNNYFFSDIKKLWYYKNYKSETSLIDLIFPKQKIEKVLFKNGNMNDYRKDNLLLFAPNTYTFKLPPRYNIISEGLPTYISSGVLAGEYRNMYWLVTDSENILENEFYIMHIKDDIYTKFSKKDLNKVIYFNDMRPTWCLTGEYVQCRIKTYENSKFCYLHQYILNVHDKDLTDYTQTVDHINQDKLDNRSENLRLVNMSEQNKNRGKQTRRTDACILPPSIILPKYIQYRKDIYNKETNAFREFFIVSHPKLEKDWETTKSSKLTLEEKLLQAKTKILEIENKITPEDIIKLENINSVINTNILSLPTGFQFKIHRDKYHFIYDSKDTKNGKRYSLTKILTSTNVQEELNNFIKDLNIKYPELKMSYHIIKENIKINENMVSIPVIENVEKTNNIKCPPNFTIYDERNSTFIQFTKYINKKKYSMKKKINKTNFNQKEFEIFLSELKNKFVNENCLNFDNLVLN